jgi:predicted RNase H-like nuclease (RuvC/YqgF family)
MAQKDTSTKTQNIRTLSTNEIQKLLKNANMDFDLVVNKALNSYLSKIFLSCPFTDEICIKKQCMGCESHDLVTQGR